MELNSCPIHDVDHKLFGTVSICPICLGAKPLWRVIEVYDHNRLRTYRVEERDLAASIDEWRTVSVCLTLGEAHLNVQTRAMGLGWTESIAIEYDARGRVLGVDDASN